MKQDRTHSDSSFSLHPSEAFILAVEAPTNPSTRLSKNHQATIDRAEIWHTMEQRQAIRARFGNDRV
jgi:hypothetical protein